MAAAARARILPSGIRSIAAMTVRIGKAKAPFAIVPTEAAPETRAARNHSPDFGADADSAKHCNAASGKRQAAKLALWKAQVMFCFCIQEKQTIARRAATTTMSVLGRSLSKRRIPMTSAVQSSAMSTRFSGIRSCDRPWKYLRSSQKNSREKTIRCSLCAISQARQSPANTRS
jgi:hypothetical protein